jgi:hypothetical protein
VAVATAADDTFETLAAKIGLDYSDCKKWLLPADARVEYCKKYTIPNTIYLDFGIANLRDSFPSAIIATWGRSAERDVARWASVGFNVVMTERVIGGMIKNHLKDKNLHGYEYEGHGAPGGILGLEHADDGDSSSAAVYPDRYTNHGISFMTLRACFSLEHVVAVGRHYKYDAWEANVARKGFLAGYADSVILLDEILLWRLVRGKNDGGLALP